MFDALNAARIDFEHTKCAKAFEGVLLDAGQGVFVQIEHTQSAQMHERVRLNADDVMKFQVELAATGWTQLDEEAMLGQLSPQGACVDQVLYNKREWNAIIYI